MYEIMFSRKHYVVSNMTREVFIVESMIYPCYVTSRLSHPGRRRHGSAWHAANCGTTKTVFGWRRPAYRTKVERDSTRRKWRQERSRGDACTASLRAHAPRAPGHHYTVPAAVFARLPSSSRRRAIFSRTWATTAERRRPALTPLTRPS